ncbi:hypothetical protein C882_3842 [Caenispirillum salinarum AK4]|jgi:hypothetical protein|uniref:Uncharacterized protein n=1 Tax=Caenispirillum salinarum AK4 TaxID=1238182 RepID=K9H333_9PROT|nr:hypothetical protein [Caenispirillum salinarum]EKV31469.1 hypothetical protein C882_3842 [Caenispirillum salinarum AK4]
MATIANVAGDMLRGAANFFRAVGQDNPNLAEQMEQNASAYEEVAKLVEADPTAEINLPEQPPQG